MKCAMYQCIDRYQITQKWKVYDGKTLITIFGMSIKDIKLLKKWKAYDGKTLIIIFGMSIKL